MIGTCRNMKKLNLAILFLALIIPNSIYPQLIKSYNDAVEIFNKYPPKYEFEGIYEIYTNSKVENATIIKGKPEVKNQDFEGFKSESKLMCIFHTENDIVGVIINQEIQEYFHFKVNESGKINYSYTCKSSKKSIYFQLTYIPDNKELTGSVEIIDSDLFFELKMPYMICEMEYANTAWSYNITAKYKLKKKYSPTIPDRKASGTGFAISSDGYIVTNYHVISESKKITIKGVNGNFQRTYIAKVVSFDKNNDLAILKINDSSFTSLSKIPYTLSKKMADVGSSVFVLGYPYIQFMGEEIKLTNGIISAKTGFQGNVSTYQISAPITHGNSGGPTFDINGNVIGVVSSGFTAAQNVSYSIKTSILFNLLESMAIEPKIPTVSILSGQTLEEQVKSVKNFIYIIEVLL